MEEIKIPEAVDIEWARKEMERTGKNKCNKDFIYYVKRRNSIDWIDLNVIGFQYSTGREYIKPVQGSYDIITKYNRKVYSIRLVISEDGMTVVKDYKSKSITLGLLRECSLHSVLGKWLLDCKSVLKYITPGENIYGIPLNSSIEVSTTCPSCKKKKKVRVHNLTNYGFSCDTCTRRKSLPETYIEGILIQNEIAFEREKTFSDLRGKNNKLPLRFDFYLPTDNVVIEVHGLQHYKNIYFYRNSTNYDNIKRQYCKDNNMQYIEINASKVYMDNIVKEVKNKIPYLNIDTNKLKEFIVSNEDNFHFYRGIKEDYLKGCSLSSIGKKYSVSHTTVINILKRLGIYEKKGCERKVKCLLTGEIFPSIKKACEQYGVHKTGLIGNLRGKRKSAGKHPETGEKLYWEYVEEQKENNKYSNNEENLHIA